MLEEIIIKQPKQGVGALLAVAEGGIIIIAANNRDREPIGSSEYKTLLHLSKIKGSDGYLELLRSPHWRFTKDQWEPEVWGKVIRKVGKDGLIYCSGEIAKEDDRIIPGTSGHEFLPDGSGHKPGLEKVQAMVQNALIHSIFHLRKKIENLPFVTFGRDLTLFPSSGNPFHNRGEKGICSRSHSKFNGVNNGKVN
jgi:hypothetical protein